VVVEKRAAGNQSQVSRGTGKRPAQKRASWQGCGFFTEANRNLKAPRLSLLLFGLKIAPIDHEDGSFLESNLWRSSDANWGGAHLVF